MPFKPGQSGNPGGRPKQEAEITAKALKHAPEAIERLLHWMGQNDGRVSVAAANALLDRALGKPKQAMEHSDDGTGPFATLMALIAQNGRPRPGS